MINVTQNFSPDKIKITPQFSETFCMTSYLLKFEWAVLNYNMLGSKNNLGASSVLTCHVPIKLLCYFKVKQ